MLCFRVLTEYHVVDICKNLAVRVSIKIRVSQVMGNPHIFCLALYSNLQAKKKKLPRTHFWNCGLEYIKQKNVFDGLVLDIIKEIDGDKIILKCLQMDR